jgi:hypothetical protein
MGERPKLPAPPSGLVLPFAIAGVALMKCVVISPLCVYSCEGNGTPTDRTLVDLGQFALVNPRDSSVSSP